ncbi:MAG: cysteine methyltransferase, partial [Pseudomonadota bacterium]
MTQIYFEYLASPIGPFLVAGTDTTLCVTGFSTGYKQRHPEPDWRQDAAPLRYATEQLAAYFDGERVDFDVPLKPMGTPFQHDVWRELQKIPYGETTTY